MNRITVDIEKAGEIFGKSVRVMRDYKRLGIIDPVVKDGMKDLYDESEVNKAKDKLSELSLSMNLKEAAEIIIRERRRNRKNLGNRD